MASTSMAVKAKFQIFNTISPRPLALSQPTTLDWCMLYNHRSQPMGCQRFKFNIPQAPQLSNLRHANSNATCTCFVLTGIANSFQALGPISPNLVHVGAYPQIVTGVIFLKVKVTGVKGQIFISLRPLARFHPNLVYVLGLVQEMTPRVKCQGHWGQGEKIVNISKTLGRNLSKLRLCIGLG